MNTWRHPSKSYPREVRVPSTLHPYSPSKLTCSYSSEFFDDLICFDVRPFQDPSFFMAEVRGSSQISESLVIYK